MNLPVLRAVAAGGGHPLVDLDFTFLIQFALFAFMAFVATRLLFKPYLKMRDDRTEAIDGARRDADQDKEEIAAKQADYERKLESTRAAALDEQRALRAEAAGYHREVTDKARTQAIEALEAARAKVRTQTEEARKDLMPRADTLARDMVAKLLGREVA
ncbi:hypothetical protein [Haliangium sp.]|uniref:F0F1 ATP synthase subunit B family protein n=1 Tax=Haliangium sp. TaxID=2663208 RepID=UPI003D145042